MSYSYWTSSLANMWFNTLLHFNLYILLEFILFSGILSRIWFYKMLLIRQAVLHLVFLNKLWTLFMSVLWSLKVTNFFLCCVCVGANFCVLIILFFSLWIICNGEPLLFSYVEDNVPLFIYFFAFSVIGSVIIVFA
jgi:hypothetical protein